MMDLKLELQEELELNGFKCFINSDGNIIVNAPIIGDIEAKILFNSLMENYYRFIYDYGLKISAYALEQRKRITNMKELG